MAAIGAGERLAGKYELIEQAGSGGMAVVWRGRTIGEAGFTRPVAIKRILPHLTDDPEFVAMFVEEARVVSRLGHPMITQIHDFGIDDKGAYFLVMEWVEGCDFAQLAASFVADGSFVPWPLVSAIGIEVLGALGAAHERIGDDGQPAPVFHRDVTPQNILLSSAGFVKLTDFGIARAMDRATMTKPNAVKGKVSYLSPERLRNKPASAQSDIFALGVCMWEAIAGVRLFDAESDMEVMFKVNEAHIPELRDKRPDVPEALDAALRTALARDPADRYESAFLFGRALADILRATDEPTDARRIGKLVRAARDPARNGSDTDLADDPAELP